MFPSHALPYPLLVTDCSTTGARVGVLDQRGWLDYRNLPGETGSVLFEGVRQVLGKSSISLNDLAGYSYCEGPGSTLGIRINAMALRTWISLSKKPKPVYAYKSLEAAALQVLNRNPGAIESTFALFSDLRKNAWNGCRVDPDGTIGPIEVVGENALKEWPSHRFFIQQRIHSPGSPPDSVKLDYDLECLGSCLEFRKLFRRTDKVTVFQTTTTAFKKWVPQRHR